MKEIQRVPSKVSDEREIETESIDHQWDVRLKG